MRGGLYTINGRQVHGDGSAPLTPPSSRPQFIRTTITTTVHLYPGTSQERQVKVEALVSLHYGKYRIDRLNPLGGGNIGAHELDAAYDAVIEAAHTYHHGTIPEQEKRGGFTLLDAMIVVGVVGILLAMATSALQRANAVKRSPDSMATQSTSTSSLAPTLYTLRHDNHLFIASNDTQSLLHHPDCPCLKTALPLVETNPVTLIPND